MQRYVWPGVAGLAALVLSCGKTPTATLTLVTGGENDAFSRPPVPTLLVVESIGVDDSKKEIARTTLPTQGDLSLGDASETDLGALRVTAFDATGRPVIGGQTLFLQFGALQDISLEVLVQRLGEFARAPRTPRATFAAPVVDLVSTRYIFAASGTSTLLYDMLFLQPLTFAPTLPRAAESVATYGATAIVVDGAGASTVDLSSGSAKDFPAPTGGTFAEIAGGKTLRASDGSVYIIGATRTGGGPSARILRISSDGNVDFAALSTPREGACATWVDGRGLVVAGGSSDGSFAEILSTTATQAAPLPFPADGTKGCGAAMLDAGHVVVAGGTNATGISPARVLDLGCVANCVPAAWKDPVPLVRGDVSRVAPDAVLLVGDDANGATLAYRASATELREVPLRVARRGGRMLVLSDGSSAIVGGAPEIELYRE